MFNSDDNNLRFGVKCLRNCRQNSDTLPSVNSNGKLQFMDRFTVFPFLPSWRIIIIIINWIDWIDWINWIDTRKPRWCCPARMNANQLESKYSYNWINSSGSKIFWLCSIVSTIYFWRFDLHQRPSSEEDGIVLLVPPSHLIFICSEIAHIHADNGNTVIHPWTWQQGRKLCLLLPLSKNRLNTQII